MKAPLGPLYCSVFECQLPKAKTDTRFTSALQRLSHSDFGVVQLDHPQAFNRHLAGSAEPFRVARPEAVGLGRTKKATEMPRESFELSNQCNHPEAIGAPEAFRRRPNEIWDFCVILAPTSRTLRLPGGRRSRMWWR